MKHVLPLGDAIRMGDRPKVRSMLASQVTVDSPEENCRFSINTPCFFSAWAEQLQFCQPEDIDLVH